MNVCPPLTCKLSTPKVLWYQTDVSVTLRIMLVDVDDYFLLVDHEHLRFSTTIKDVPYYLCLYFFGAVIPEKCTHRNFSREIRITLPKALRWFRWMRLTLKKQYNPHIVVDPDKVEDEQLVLKKFIDTERNTYSEDYKRENIDSCPPPPSSSSEELESDDEMMDALIDEF